MKGLLYGSNSSGDGAISKEAEASAAKISTYYANNVKIAALGEIPPKTPCLAKTDPEAPTEVDESNQIVSSDVHGMGE